jgi:hypothetical protein
MAKKPIKSINLLPEFLRTDKNSKFLSSTIDQLIQPPELERLDGFIGSKLTPTYVSTSDIYISESLPLRRNFQLEPALVVKTELGAVKEAKAIDDLANEIMVEGGFENDFDRLFRSEVYSFDPHIDFDKFVNYQKYYWLVNGPDTITITGKQLNSTSTYTVADNEINSAWVFSPDGLTEDPTIVLYRGNTYQFSVNSQYNFFIKTAPSAGLDDIYNINVTNNGTKSGVVTITIDENTPSTLYYVSDTVDYVQGKIVIKQATEDAYVNVEQEILGKKTYTSGTKLTLSNGMKISFGGEVYPETYKDKEFFVEGVGNSIRLIDLTLLTGSEILAAQFDDDFDASNFDNYPFDSYKQLPLVPEYMTINRGSKDLNPWTRYNRWVHEDVIIASAQANGNAPVVPADKRAKRPIIEFAADIQLYNFGSIGVRNVDLIDTETLDAFSIVEGSAGYHVDGVLLEQGFRVVFNADVDDMVRGKIYEVNFVNINGIPRLELKETNDHEPLVGASLSTNLGTTTAGKSWWFDGDVWKIAQQHDTLNQAPLFDVFDSNGTSYSSSVYSTDFKGTKVFSYEVGTGTPDPVLGFPLSYQNTVSVGSFKFKNYFNSDVISIFENNRVTAITTAKTYLRFNKDTKEFANVWTLTEPYEIPILQLSSTTGPSSAVELTAINNPDTATFTLHVYINGYKIPDSRWYITTSPAKCFVNFYSELPAGTNVLFKIFTRELANNNGQYETPVGLTNNPLNGIIDVVTLTEISDHLRSMTSRDPEFTGAIFGSNNVRDLPNITKYGTRLVSNVNPIAFANFFLGIKEHNAVNAIQKSADQYNQFKLNLFKKISEIGNINDPITALDNVMTSLNSDKDLNSPWYFSDMVAYGTDRTTRTWTITNTRNTLYPIVSDYNPDVLGLRSVLVYLNGRQLLLGTEYRFLVNDSRVELLTEFSVGDELRVDDYFSTEGSYVPSTPSKLGLYPKFQPKIYVDTSYVTPTKVIQGHDGSITVAFDDFRDDIILEFEKRVYNNIKTSYRTELLDINSVLPGAFRQNDYSLEEVNTILQSDFIKWAGFYNVDYIPNASFDLANSFTWNYVGGYNAVAETSVSGYWRSFFKYFYDTDRPNTHPWEMLGFSEQPMWWEDEYGPAPYTSGNTILWNDLEAGLIKQGDRAGIDTMYVRPGLSQIIPVDEFGNIVDPSQLITDTTPYNIRQSWVFGDHGPAETSWRRSSYWPFAVQRLLALTKPATYSSLMYDPSRINKNIAGQWAYGDDFEFLDLRKLLIHGDQRTLTSGYSVYVSEFGSQRNSTYISTLKSDLAYVDFNLFHKVGGFISKNKIQIVIDAIEPSSTSPGALLPQESYKLILNTSNPIKTASISGIIIQKSNGKFVVNGYNKYKPYFSILNPRRNSSTPVITVGGVSESFVDWAPSSTSGNSGLSGPDISTALPAPTGNFYQQGQIVRYGQKYYRTKISHRSGSTFNTDNFVSLPYLPIKGGVTVQIANGFDNIPVDIPYGTEFEREQDLYDVIVGYGKWLEREGFIFDEYNSDLNEVVNWDLSAKEFLYWTTQNWADNSIITLSPFAEKVKYTLPNSVVDNVFDDFYEYSLLKADGLSFPQKNLNVSRHDGVCTIETVNTTDGIYFVRLNSVQKEHAIVFDNITVFNDTIYNIQTGYRQRRMKLVGFRTSNWNGDYFSPGFVFDEAVVNDWKKYTSYIYGDTVRYNGNYYSAKENVPASTTFDFNAWVLLNEKPVQDLIPNFEYKINQFEDFYSLDIDNFDAAQQKMAQHLIGYTPRVYLNNVFTNPISQYKFYQGFIKEKGTRNAVQKMAKASIFNFQGETTYTEEWAFRLGQYGSYTSFEEIEIELEEGTFIENPQIINFVKAKPNNPIDLIYYTTSSNISISPDDYDPSTTFATTSTNNFKLPIAGYVSFEDITATAYNENSLLDIANANQINNGDIIWLGFKSNGDWDVLKYTLSSSRVVGVYVSSPGTDITFVTDRLHGLSVGDIISVTRFNDQVNGVYLVKAVPELNQFTVASTLVTIINEDLLSPGLLYQFKTVRASSFDTLPSDRELLKAPIGSTFWVDNQTQDGTFNWEVYKKINNYSNRKIQSGYPAVVNQKLGYSLSKRENNDVFLVGAPGFSTNLDNGRVFAYVKNNQSSARILSYSLNNFIDQYHSSTSTTEFGAAVSYSSNIFAGTEYGLMYAGAPGVGNVSYTSTSITHAIEGGILINQPQIGAVKISSVDPVTREESSEIVLVSPNFSSYERFGQSVVVGGTENNLYVGAPGTSTVGTGSVYTYQTLSPVVSYFTSNTSTVGSSRVYINNTSSVAIGQSVWISGVLNDIVNGYKVNSIFDDGLTQYVVLDQLLTADVPANSAIKFYNTSTLAPTQGLFTSTNGLLISYTGVIRPTDPTTGDEFGYSIDVSSDGMTGVISAPGRNYVEIFINSGTGTVIQSVLTATTFSTNTGTRFGESVAISRGGEYLFVGAPYSKNEDDSFGKVVVFNRIGNTFTYTTTISNPIPGAALNFGQEIAICGSTNTLAISSIGVNKNVPVAFDAETTNFDSSSTFFYDVIENFGTVYVYNKAETALRFALAAEVTPPISVGLNGTNFGYSLAVDENTIFVGAPSIDSITTSSFYQFTKIDSSKNSLELYKSHGDTADIDTIQSIRLINTFDETVVDYLDVVDPIKGKIVGIAEQELKYKSAYDPAVYSIGTAGVVVDSDTSWLDEHVGELWWDLSTVKYVWYEQGDLTYRKNNWGSIFPGAAIDVYEWVRTPYLPSEWSAVADTSAGLTEGISGQPKYVDNSSISVKQIYNSVSNSFSNVYYYWVKNKVTVPASKNRRISSYQVSSIIADPAGYGLKYASIIGKDAITLANVGPLLVDNRIHLNVAYDTIKNTVPKHTEWTLLEEGSANSMPPALYEKKLFDSLLGRDSLGNIVPDPTLTERTRYGVGIRPRQTMFKNRKEALRTLIEFVNSVLIDNQITGSYSFANLDAQEAPPNEYSHQYDQIVEDNEGINIIDARNFEQAALTCTVLNGKIRSVSIVKSGLGYKIAPNVVVENVGSGAVIETEIDSLGRVITANIVEAGKGYFNAPILTVRPYTVIVLADNLYNGKWTKFEWNQYIQQWERKQTQKYNTSLYWEYIDWQSANYNEFIDYAYIVDQVYQLDTLEDLIQGQYVKIKNVGDGRFGIVEKAAEGELGTFGKGFNLVYSQNGTIQILNKIWDVRNTNLGFDQNNNYDQTLYDQTPDLELGYILTALKEDIFVNELKINWNLFFFKAVKYALTEQKLLDWAFKTSFINVTNYAGILDQRPVYKLQTSKNYEDYIREVKPYHSQIRTFTANHSVFEPSNSFITDFDSPAYYNQTTNQFESVEIGNPLLEQQPWKAWSDNYLYTVGSIVVGNSGAGYTYPPQVIIETAPGDSGSGATANAYISSGKVSKIEVINPGSGYKISPKVILTGGGNTNLVPAVAYAQLSNGKVRTNYIGIKIDRISKTPSIGSKRVLDTFICDGSTSEFTLTWFADPDKTKFTVTINGELVLSSDYKLVSYQERYNDYNKDFTKVVFINEVPLYGQTLEISYIKNVELFNAAERIIEYYTATSGMPGKELPQLMSGIEYPGISVQGLPFDYTSNWDVEYSPFGKSSYSDNISYYSLFSITAEASTGTDTVEVSTTTGIAVGQIVNIISADKSLSTQTVFSRQVSNPVFDVRVVSINTLTSTVQFNSTLSESLSKVSTEVYVDGVLTTVTNIASIEFWSYDSNATILDSAIEGGTFIEGALGINPEDTVIDGDGFITPNTSFGPEELIPGEAHDSIGINVYTRFNEGAPTVYNGTIDVYASTGTVTSATLSFVPPNAASIFVTFDGRNFSYTTGTNHLTTLNVSEFSYDWANNTIYIGPQSSQGKLGYTVVSIGGGRPNTEAGVIDRGFAVVEDGSTEAEVLSISGTSTVKSAYVTVNGMSIPRLQTANTTTLGYMLITSAVEPRRAAAHVYNLSTGTSSVQAWFFGTENKYFNEFKEEIFDIGVEIKDTFTLSQPPGTIEPAAANIIVELDQGNGYRRLQPPFISYYKVDPEVTTYKIDNNINRQSGSTIISDVRVYLNGSRVSSGVDYAYNYEDQTIEFRGGVLRSNDVLAILSLPKFYPTAEFDVDGSELTILPPVGPLFNSRLKVTTFTIHDDMLVRTESFLGNLNRRYKVSRPIVNNNYVWVTVDGKLLVNKYDYSVLDDARTVELSDKWNTTESNLVVITTLSSDKLSDTILGYRIFNDIFGRTHYKRLAKANSTVLAAPLLFTDTEIHVADSTVLMPPLLSKKIPGVVIIDGERIEYFKVEGNTLKQLRRSTLGTSPSTYLPAGTKVIDQSPEQNIPYVDRYYRQAVLTDNSTATYTINPVASITTVTLGGDHLISNGIILSTTSTVNPIDQIEVYYGGRKLRKSGKFNHDNTISFDSPVANVLGFTATTSVLPATDVINDAYIVQDTHQVWVYTGSIEKDSINGYVYKGLNYLEPEFSVTVSIDTSTAVIYATTALQMANNLILADLAYDIDGDGRVTVSDAVKYQQLAAGEYVNGINENSNYATLLSQHITLNIANGIQDNVRLEIIKKGFEKSKIWNDQITSSTTKSLMDSSTLPARFLQAKLSELPGEYYYGGSHVLGYNNGLALTDENNQPLEGL